MSEKHYLISIAMDGDYEDTFVGDAILLQSDKPFNPLDLAIEYQKYTNDIRELNDEQWRKAKPKKGFKPQPILDSRGWLIEFRGFKRVESKWSTDL